VSLASFLISGLALAGIGVYELVRVSRAAANTFSLVQVGSGLYLDAAAGVIAAGVAIYALVDVRALSGLATAGVILGVAIVAITLATTHADDSTSSLGLRTTQTTSLPPTTTTTSPHTTTTAASPGYHNDRANAAN
jgi:hypothetical membrane protein